MASIYPDDEDGHTLRGLAAEGNDMSKPMDIDFHVAAPDEDAAREVAGRAAKLGYRAEVFFDDEEADLDQESLPSWTCECTKTMVPCYESIVAAQRELDDAARPSGAYVDGWGTFGNVDGSG
jgi:regulator of RNase E activity RraB